MAQIQPQKFRSKVGWLFNMCMFFRIVAAESDSMIFKPSVQEIFHSFWEAISVLAQAWHVAGVCSVRCLIT